MIFFELNCAALLNLIEGYEVCSLLSWSLPVPNAGCTLPDSPQSTITVDYFTSLFGRLQFLREQC